MAWDAIAERLAGHGYDDFEGCIVAEMVTGVDLVKEQLRLAWGEKLTVRNGLQARGHAIECRINAEHPETFRPSPGKVAISPVTVGWICMARWMTVYGAFAYIMSTRLWTISSQPTPSSDALGVSLVSASIGTFLKPCVSLRSTADGDGRRR